MYTAVYGNVHGFIRICTRPGNFIRKCTRVYTEMYTAVYGFVHGQVTLYGNVHGCILGIGKDL